MKKKLSENFNAITKWSKSKQADIISDIVSKYPTAKLFKEAIIKGGDPKSVALVKNMDPNMSKSQYIDFLQYVFVKHSDTGKILANSLVGLGVGGLLAYIGGKEAARRAELHQGAKEIGAKYDPLRDKTEMPTDETFSASPAGKLSHKVGNVIATNPLFKDTGASETFSTVKDLGKVALDDKLTLSDKLHKVNAAIPRDFKDKFHLSKLISNASEDIKNNAAVSSRDLALDAADIGNDVLKSYNRIDDAKSLGRLGGAAVGGLAGGLGGASVSNAIQNWNKKKAQEKIDALKYT